MGCLRIVGLLCTVLVTVVSAPLAQATIVPTSTSFLSTAPLLITSYRTSDAGRTLDFVEIYNDDDAPIDLETWQLIVTTNSDHVLRIVPSGSSGYVEPGQHVVVTKPGLVAGASYEFGDWVATFPLDSIITGLSLTKSAYRAESVALSSKTADQWMTRRYNTSSYSTASSPFEPKSRELFDDGIYTFPASSPALKIVEVYSYASDCAPNDDSVLCGDYVKLQNTGREAIDLDGLVLRSDSSSSSRTASNTFSLTGVLAPGKFVTVWQTDDGKRVALTNSGGYLWLEDAWGMRLYDDTMTQYDGASSGEQGLALAVNDTGAWVWTSTPMPDSANIITVPSVTIAPCPSGKYRNPDTGRCRNIEEAINALAVCDEGKERNPLTNRCRSVTSASSSLTPCKAGQERSPATNRCRSVLTASAQLTPCSQGQERNPATNRCRKVLGASSSKTDYPVEPYAVQAGGGVVWWGLAGIALGALGYGVWEWRRELALVGASAWSRIGRWRK